MLLRNFTRGLLKPNRINLKSIPVDTAICIDIECTCDSPIQVHPMEVIELACAKVDLSSTSKSNTPEEAFHSFVRPVINPDLTLFCQELTGITQGIVDKAPPIKTVLDKLFEWLGTNDLINESYDRKQLFAFASCGNFDINTLAPIVRDSHFHGDLDLPIYFKEWINVKKTFFNHKGEWPKGLYHMMDLLDEEPYGRQHSAEDDCRNLAKVVERLHEDGCKFHITSKLNSNRAT